MNRKYGCSRQVLFYMLFCCNKNTTFICMYIITPLTEKAYDSVVHDNYAGGKNPHNP